MSTPTHLHPTEANTHGGTTAQKGGQSQRSTTTLGSNSHNRTSAHKLRSTIILAGAVRKQDISLALDGTLLDLPILPAGTLYLQWRDHVSGVAQAIGTTPLTLRVRLSQGTRTPAQPPDTPSARIIVEHDTAEFRGTGGLLRDIAKECPPDEMLLVCNANQVLLRPLAKIVDELASCDAEAVIHSEPDGRPNGIYLLRAGLFADVRPVGFLDFKEQVLPELAKNHDVRVVRAAHPSTSSVRSLDQYIRTLQSLAIPGGLTREADPFHEEWTKHFSLVAEGAHVESNALVHDSVVMPGARVGGGAVLVRSLVCPGAVVPAGAVVFDQVFGSSRSTGGGR
jgi:hypothetical protein